MSEQEASAAAEGLTRFAAATGRPIAAEYVGPAAELSAQLAKGLAAIPDDELREVEPVSTFRVGE